ncbi:MAG: dephospho-CoA kinase [Dehalococcoidia bacterium]|nr:dephospho-CoA kinase [Dehalococcoidia bacterium]
MNLGITGNIGTGKSTILTRLEQIGLDVYNLDMIAKSTYKKGLPAYSEIISSFDNILDKNEEIDIKKLSEIVFKNKDKLDILQNIVWPKVREFIIEVKNSNKKNIVFEGALLISANWHKLLDHIWIIDADIEIVKKRLISQRNINEKNYQNILNNQQLAAQMISILDKDKIPYSVIINNTKKNDLNKIIDKKISEII